MKTRKSPGNSDCDGTRTKQVAAGERTFKGRWRLRAHVQRNVPFGRTFTEVTILPLILSLGGPAVAPVNTEAAPPVTADAEAPFSCSSPLLFVRLFLFPLLLFWLGIMVRSVWMQPASEHLCGYHVESAWWILCEFECTGDADVTVRSSSFRFVQAVLTAEVHHEEGVPLSCFDSCSEERMFLWPRLHLWSRPGA